VILKKQNEHKKILETPPSVSIKITEYGDRCVPSRRATCAVKISAITLCYVTLQSIKLL